MTMKLLAQISIAVWYLLVFAGFVYTVLFPRNMRLNIGEVQRLALLGAFGVVLEVTTLLIAGLWV